MLAHVDNRITYSGNGNATEFAYQFKILDRTDIKVLLTDADGKEKLLTKDYYVDVEKNVVRYPGYAVGAEVPESERPPVLPAGWKLTIYREVPVTQETDLPDQYPFNQVEDIGDKLTMIAQQLTDVTSRSLKISVNKSADIDTTIPFDAGKSFRIADDGKSIVLTEDPGKVIDGATALLKQTTEQAESANEAATNAQNAATHAEVQADSVKKYKALWFDSVAAMKAEPSLTAGAYVCTAGYYTPNDGGSASYLIRAKTDNDTDDGGSLHELANGLVAELIVENGTVCPEQFGAKGNGVSDDTSALQKCFNLDIVSVVLAKKYIITGTIRISKSKHILGGGTLYHPSNDSLTNLLYFKSDVSISSVIIENIAFESVRDNTNIFPPFGHERHSESLSSNVSFIYLDNANKVLISNVTFDSSEHDIIAYNCQKIVVDNFVSKNSSGFTFMLGNKNVIFNNGYSELYPLLGSGDHHYYICAGHDNVTIKNAKMLSGQYSGSYPLHFYAAENQLKDYGPIKNVVVDNCYIEGHTMLATVCSDTVSIRNTIFKQIFNSEYFIYANGSAKVSFCNVNIIVMGRIGFNGLVNNGSIEFIYCTFNYPIFINDVSNNIPIIFNNCKLTGVSCSVGLWNALFYNCIINSSEYAIYSVHSTDSTLEFYNCKLLANADGVFSVRSSATLTLIKCYGENKKETKKVDYNNDYNPTINMYDCCFPDLSIRTNTNTIWNIAGNTLAN